uniref:Uncharacterized protein n=1 Tax=Romanomermis culicivorax TaxID=13658 RepID=A0A915I0Q9_ROMCU
MYKYMLTEHLLNTYKSINENHKKQQQKESYNYNIWCSVHLTDKFNYFSSPLDAPHTVIEDPIL